MALERPNNSPELRLALLSPPAGGPRGAPRRASTVRPSPWLQVGPGTWVLGGQEGNQHPDEGQQGPWLPAPSSSSSCVKPGAQPWSVSTPRCFKRVWEGSCRRTRAAPAWPLANICWSGQNSLTGAFCSHLLCSFLTKKYQTKWGLVQSRFLCSLFCFFSALIFILPNRTWKSVQMKNKLPASHLIASLFFFFFPQSLNIKVFFSS